MEDLSAPAQGLLEGGRAHGHDHELLRVHSVGGMCAAVQDVHHGDGQTVAVHTAEEAVEGHVQRSGSGAACSDGHGQNGVCAQIGLILGAVGLQHGSIDCVDVGSVQPHHSIGDDGVDVLNGFGHALTKIAAIGQRDLGFHSGVAAGVQDLAADNRFDFQIVHTKTSR